MRPGDLRRDEDRSALREAGCCSIGHWRGGPEGDSETRTASTWGQLSGPSVGPGRGRGHLLCPGGQALPTQRQKTGFWLCGPEASDPLRFGFCCPCFSLPSSPSEEGCMPGPCTFSEKRNRPQHTSALASVMALGGKSRLWGWREGTPHVKGAESGGRMLLPRPPTHTVTCWNLGEQPLGAAAPGKPPSLPPYHCTLPADLSFLDLTQSSCGRAVLSLRRFPCWKQF